MLIRAVYDANIFISGLIFHGNPGRCLDLVVEGRVECYVCIPILGEVADILSRKSHHDSGRLGDELA